MHISQHADQRLNQRGISRRLVDFTLRHGRVDGDKYVLDDNESLRLIEKLREDLRLAQRVLDKGGVTVVESNDTLVTAYNVCTRAAARAGMRAARRGREHARQRGHRQGGSTHV